MNTFPMYIIFVSFLLFSFTSFFLSFFLLFFIDTQDMLSESSELSSRMDFSFWTSEDQSLSGESISVRIQSMIQSFLTSHRIRALAFRISARILPMEVWKEKLMLKDGTNRKSLSFVDVDEDVLP